MANVDADMLGKVIDLVHDQGGAIGLGYDRSMGWLVSVEFGYEAPDSPMVGGVSYGSDETLNGALVQVVREMRL